jgi:hypothetical protein
MDILVHGQNGLDGNERYWTGLFFIMDVNPNSNSNINVKWTNVGKIWEIVG